jgi:ankyrin repeat protein
MWHTETPLHRAASSDDSDLALALSEGGADLDVAGASIAGGTALDNAVGDGCWHVARLLVGPGAKVDALWTAAGLGRIERVKELMAAEPPPIQEEIDHGSWQACHGGQRRTAEYLLACGADINAAPDHTRSTPLDAAPGPDTRREAAITWLRGHGAKTAEELSVEFGHAEADHVVGEV